MKILIVILLGTYGIGAILQFFFLLAVSAGLSDSEPAFWKTLLAILGWPVYWLKVLLSDD